jgi:hypothetical protein
MQEKKGSRDTIHCRVEINSYFWRGGGAEDRYRMEILPHTGREGEQRNPTGWRSYLILERRWSGYEEEVHMTVQPPSRYWSPPHTLWPGLPTILGNR